MQPIKHIISKLFHQPYPYSTQEGYKRIYDKALTNFKGQTEFETILTDPLFQKQNFHDLHQHLSHHSEQDSLQKLIQTVYQYSSHPPQMTNPMPIASKHISFFKNDLVDFYLPLEIKPAPKF